MRDAELQAAREERDLAVRDKMDAMRIQCVRCGDAGSGEAADATSGSGTDEKDTSLIPELLRKAWEQRDGAVRRKNAVQVQLARTRVDVLQANGQLMEAIGQKVELSQQLEQWQVRISANYMNCICICIQLRNPTDCVMTNSVDIFSATHTYRFI